MMLSGKLFSRCPISKTKLLNGIETSFRRALISNNSLSLVLNKELWVRKKNGRVGGEIVILSITSTSTQIPNHKQKSYFADELLRWQQNSEFN